MSTEHVEPSVESDAAPAANQPVGISLVVPMYQVAEYLPDLLRSLQEQEPGDYRIEVIFVDDGSPDDCGDIARRWLDSTGIEGTVITTENQGVSGARNTGMAAASLEWIGFPDPDDYLSRAYLKRAAAFIRSARGRRSHIVAANVLRYDEETAQIRDVHALRFRFKGGAKTVDLSRSPHYIHMMVNAAFMRLDALRAADLWFPEGLKLSEDAIFVARFLSTIERPILGVVPNSVYYYRKRRMKTSALDIAPSEPASYIDRFKYGYLPLIQSLAAGDGVPEWLGNVVLYELRWLFSRELNPKTKATVLDAELNAEFLVTLAQLLRHVQDGWILGFRVISMSLEVRFLLLTLKGSALPDDAVYIHKLDADKNLMQLRYYFVGHLPSEEIRIRAKPVVAVAAKVRSLPYFGQQLLSERILWVPANSWLAVDIDGQRRQLKYGTPSIPQYALTERAIWAHFNKPLPARPRDSRTNAEPPRRVRSVVAQVLRDAKRSLVELVGTKAQREAKRRRREVELMRELAAKPRVRRRYAEAWVFMDRLSMGQDNAEHLYRHVVSEHPDINAWFVLQKDSPDWARLERSGFRLVDYRSREHHLLMLNAAHVISSHLDVEFVMPIEPRYYPTKPDWKFTFLQHGVSKDDMSAWFNQKPIELLVTATDPEYHAMTRDGSAYNVTSKEVVLTGFPRHDGLLAKQAMRGQTPKVLLLAPTWRDELFKPKDGWAGPRRLIDNFWHTDYATSWFGLVRSESLLRSARERGWEIWFLPHPMLQPHVSEKDLPPGARLIRYSDGNIQDVLARASVMVTDYSSLAFESAYLETPVVYFHFDRSKVFAGGHIYQKGDFDYERDGFGPVVDDLDAAVSTLTAQIERDGEAPERYRVRAERTFPFRDGRCSERVVQAIRDLTVPVRPV